MVMAWVSRKITARDLLRNLSIVYASNLVGAAGLAGIVALSGPAAMNAGALGRWERRRSRSRPPR